MEDIGNYIFNFENEVANLRHALDGAADDITFAEVDIMPPEGLIGPTKVEILHIAGDSIPEANNSSRVRADIVLQYNKEQGRGSYAGAVLSASGESLPYISLRKDEPFTDAFDESNKSLMRLFGLYHETAHIFISGPIADKDHSFCECAADAYAALRFFQRFGQEAESTLSMISWLRSFKALHKSDTAHLTTTVLDKIIDDSASMDFSALKPDETVILAAKYALEWTPPPDVLAAARKVFPSAGSINLKQISETCLTSPNDLAFYIGAKLFQPYLRPEGVIHDDEAVQLPDEVRLKLAALIEERAEKLTLSFDSAAKHSQKTPVSKLLKVSRPKGQKHTVVKI